ncbi:MAG: phenylalanine--tRNA ligase subunit beta [Gammaproteobacteria bacterium]|nr:phenylalanine--tRNA ligase subunit beta [Gammaproteobacteria bacterium]
MKFSKNWLLEWVDPNVSTEQLGDKFTSLGFEIENVIPAAIAFNHVVVAEILETTRHPDAEKLQVCTVSDGTETYQIVCGAKNARAGLKVALAKIDAVLPNGLKISKATLRGIESFGMLCSSTEIGLTESSEGILELPADAPLGKSIYDHFGLNDEIIEVAITPNRGDCMSMKGLAREIAVGYQVKLNTRGGAEAVPFDALATKVPQRQDPEQKHLVTVKSPDLCPRYTARIIKNIDPNAKTPIWLQEKLRRSGMHSIHPIVDIANYVMLEIGQPMHAFDLAKISGDIQVRLAQAGEQLELLNDTTVKLRTDTLVIADSKTPLAIAGIMGGKVSGVTASTRDILLESAFFSPSYTMGHARHYNITTDSAQRFERGVDPHITLTALNRATQLILDICGGDASEITEVISQDKLPQAKKISLRRARIARILGITIADTEVVRILETLGMSVASNHDGWDVQTPTWRFDLNIEVDLIEELARVYGFTNIPAHAPVEQLTLKVDPEALRSTYAIKQRLANCGYYETLTYSFIDPKWQDLLFPKQESLKLINPLSADLSVMRTSLWPNLLNALINNQNYQQERVRLFEVGRVFLPTDKGLTQPLHLGGIIAGSALPEQWGAQTRTADFFDVKGDLELLLKPCGELQFMPVQSPILHPGQSAQIFCNDLSIGILGALHPAISQQLKMTNNVLLFELDLDKIAQIVVPQFTTVSKFPAIRRDLAMVVREEITFKQVYDIVQNSAGQLVTDINIFDVYQGAGIEAGNKSLALRLTLQTSDRTLVEEEVNQVIEQVINSLKVQLQAKLR